MSTINIPREPNDALLRPFIGCPSAELPEAWSAMVRVAEGQNARAGTAPAALLTKPARVGGGSFGVGVPERYVIETAQRHYEQEGERKAMTAEQFAEEERQRRSLWELVHGPLIVSDEREAFEAFMLKDTSGFSLKREGESYEEFEVATYWHFWKARASLVAPAAPSTHTGILAAAAHIRAKASAYAEECGSYDPDTGAFEMRDAVQEYYNTLDELAEEIRLLADKAAPAVDAALPSWWPNFIQCVAELPDRNSPEREPDAMVATAEELGACAIAAQAKEGCAQ